MRFLLDQNQPSTLCEYLADAGHDCVHTRDLAMSRASDTQILEHARDSDRIIISADTDFGELLARSNAAKPSVILVRRQQDRRAGNLAALLIANLPTIETDLDNGAIVVLDDTRIRIRSLPLNPDDPSNA